MGDVTKSAPKQALLTDEMIVRWIRLFHEKVGKWPSTLDKIVWDKNEKGEWFETGENWRDLSTALREGKRGLLPGSSLIDLRNANDCNDHLKRRTIIRWIVLFHEKTGTYPNVNDKTVWDKDEKGRWIVLNESWNAINLAFMHEHRGLKGIASSLAVFKRQNGFHDDLTKEQLLEYVALFYEKTGRPPVKKDKIVYGRNEAGDIVMLDETWLAIDHALKSQGRGLKGAPTSLAQFTKENGFIDTRNHLSEAQIIQWMHLFKEKEGRWPQQKDRTVWTKDSKKGWVIVENESWIGIDSALRQGLRGLQYASRSLPELKKKLKADPAYQGTTVTPTRPGQKPVQPSPQPSPAE